MAQVIKTTFQLRRGLLETWERNNPVLAKGEPSFVVDKNALKIGDGVTPWKELEYIGLSQEDLAKAIEDYFKENPGSGTGADGRGIVSITRTSGDGAPGTTDIYTITYTDLTTSTFTVYNGRDGEDGKDGVSFWPANFPIDWSFDEIGECDIRNIQIPISRNLKEYDLILGTDGNVGIVRWIREERVGIRRTFNSLKGQSGQDGRGITSILRTSGNGAPGSTDTYTINYNDYSASTFTVYNGKDGENGSGNVVNNDFFLVEIDENDLVSPPTFTANRSLEEIFEASRAGKVVVCRLNPFKVIVLPVIITNVEAWFSTIVTIPDELKGDSYIVGSVMVDISADGVKVHYQNFSEEISQFISEALTEAKQSGEFDGRGITSIRKTSGDSAPGTTDIYTIEYTDGSTSTFSIYNGKDGSTAEIESKETQIFQVSSFDSLPISNVNLGDFGIVKTPLINDKYSYSAYVYTENGWAAMDGNYSADNVYFDEDLLVTTKIGTIQTLTNGQATLPAKGKTLKQVFSSLIAERKAPTATLPSGTVEWTNYENGNYLVEVGETITPTWKTTFSAGSYTYGPATGVTPIQAKVYLSTNSSSSSTINAGEMNGKTGSLSALTLKDTSTKHYAKVDYGWTSGTSTPKDNFGDDHVNTSKNLPIQAASNKTDTSTYYIQGYRKAFFVSRVSPIELNSPNIRALADSVNSSNSSFTMDIDEGVTQVVIAVPPGRVVKKVEDNGAFGQDILEAFDKHLGGSGIKVGGADATGSNIGAFALYYNVYVYNPSTPLGTNTYTVTLGDE